MVQSKSSVSAEIEVLRLRQVSDANGVGSVVRFGCAYSKLVVFGIMTFMLKRPYLIVCIPPGAAH